MSRKPTVQPEREEARLIQQLCIAQSVTPVVIKLSIINMAKSVFCVASRDTKLEIVDQVDGDQEDKGW